MISLAELVRMPAGATETYLLAPNETEQTLLKKLSTYARRARAKVDHRVALVVFLDNDAVRRMVVCSVIKQGVKRKKRGKKKGSSRG